MKKYIIAFTCLFLMAFTAFAQKAKAPATKHAPIDLSKFVLVEGGTYTMGTDKTVEPVEGPPHQVTVGSFYLAKTETTFEDFDKYTSATKRDSVMAGKWGRGKQPVIFVSWLEATRYCNWLSEKEKLSKCYIINDTGKVIKVTYLDTAKGYRLPTEAEWEYAARGGNKSKGTIYAGSDNIDAVAWYKANSDEGPKPVAQKAANELGLFDMNGNVWEWCWDIYDGEYYRTSPVDNPKGPETGPYRVMRGGAWYNVPNYARVFTRQNHHMGFKQNSVGFRVARTYY
jgi:formylglycine-generating enzyme required for sulfatase activity